MSSDPNLRRNQIEAYEAVLKALSVVKLDWSNRKLLAELRRQLNITQKDYVALLEKVLQDPEVKSSKGQMSRRGISESENETDTERDEDYRKEDDDMDEESYSEGSNSKPNKLHSEVGAREGGGKSKRKTKKRPASGGNRRATKQKAAGNHPDTTSGRNQSANAHRNPLTHDDVQHYEMVPGGDGHGGLVPISSMKPPYEKNVFESYLLNGTLEELKEMNRHIKKRRQTLINAMLDDEDDNGDYSEDDIVQKILLREKNARQEKLLESELKMMMNKE